MRKAWQVVTCLALPALALSVAACGGSDDNGSSAGGSGSKQANANCTAQIGVEAPITGQVAQLGGEQLHFAQLAVEQDNAKNKTKISVVQGDTQLQPAQATTVTRQFVANDKIVAIVGPAGSQEVSAIGTQITRGGLATVAGSATATDLTKKGSFPTFFRVVPRDDVQGPQDAKYIVDNIKPKAVMLVDDQTSYSTGLADAMTPVLEQAGVKIDRESVSQKQTDFSSLVSKVTPDTGVVILPWQVAANAQQLGENLKEQNKSAVIFGTDGLYSPDQFKIPGSYVSSFAPDITGIRGDEEIVKVAKEKFGSFGTFGPGTYAATHVVNEAIAAVCKAGDTPSRKNVLEQIKKTNLPESILGQPIKFDSNGDLIDAKFFLFKVGDDGKYTVVP
ncbi:branched-chain amino acid ABC transporter substrate-binding protein [Candidatus Solirubrobacter pratensis]|uniref:branched-chain amino acid ABC transporter substrate-binding protein n=1 Tax=Candidatus Solirubrobacter pratensis TaxID=1298857 RepID=UPI0004890F56|nr:branched-chain amino acid ABC transporter substrate-binding protein [Candidatus Solirubrobacter pratensis]